MSLNYFKQLKLKEIFLLLHFSPTPRFTPSFTDVDDVNAPSMATKPSEEDNDVGSCYIPDFR